ncbi:MAG: hypothetical protein NTU41_00805, partial [Chloroflexi bacterium]|nr:hypothetical protein [Chloroflexota bacterium]
ARFKRTWRNQHQYPRSSLPVPHRGVPPQQQKLPLLWRINHSLWLTGHSHSRIRTRRRNSGLNLKLKSPPLRTLTEQSMPR